MKVAVKQVNKNPIYIQGLVPNKKDRTDTNLILKQAERDIIYGLYVVRMDAFKKRREAVKKLVSM